MRVVLDTNVLVRAAQRSDGPARAVLERITGSSLHAMLLSPYILDEARRVLAYPRLRERWALSDDDVESYLRELRARSTAVAVPVHEPAQGISPDPDDDSVILTAIRGRAEILCTRDRDLLLPSVQTYCAARDVAVMTDVELLNLLRQRAPRKRTVPHA